MNIFFRVHQHFPFIHQHFPSRHSTSSIFNHAHRHLPIYPPPPPITHTRIHWTKLENTGDEHLLSGSPTFPFHSPTFPFETFNILHLQPRSPSLTNLPPPPITHTRIHWTKLENTRDEHLLSGSPTFPFHSPTFPFETFNILHLQPRSPSLTNLPPPPSHTHTHPLNEIREHWGWTSSFGFEWCQR